MGTILPLARVPRATCELALPPSVDPAALSAEFDRALAEIEERWPDAPVRDDAFAAHVRAHLGAERDLASRLPRLRITELFLAWWAMTAPGGVAAFLEVYGHDLARSIACVSSRFAHVDARGLLRHLIDELFDGPEPRALEFAGFGSLGAWLDVVATQALLDVAHAAR
jgi:hypothetical protein